MEALARSIRRTQLNRLHANRQRLLQRSINRMKSRAPGSRLPFLSLTDAIYGWGNEGWSADEDYLARIVSEAEATKGRIVECGSGLSTLLLATVAARTGVEVHALEHNEEWRQRVLAALAENGLRHVTVHAAPLRNYGAFDWYSIPEQFPQGVSLVVCDGPPAATLGGRYGMLPVLRSRLASECTVLLDDAVRAPEIAVLDRWEAEAGATSERHQTRKGFARVTIRSTPG